MNAKVTVVLGPARVGKTTRLLERYRQRLRSPGAFGQALWIAPTHRAADAIRARILEGLPGCFSPNCYTFAQFAEALIRSSLVPIRPLDRVQQQQLIGRFVDEALRRDALRYFGPIAHTDGLIDLVTDLIGDLKRQEIWPDEFRLIGNQLGGATKDRELADLYERYQALLNQHQLYDEPGRFWSARDLLGQGQTAPFTRVSLVVVDGFADFTRTQHEILAILRNRVDELLISLPYDESAGGRQDLFQKSIATLAELERGLPGLVREASPRPAPSKHKSPAATFAHIEQHLFRDPRLIKPRAAADGLEILAAPGALGEIELLARRIKRLLVEGHVRNGSLRVAPADIAVVFRSTADVAPIVREVFDEFGIPFTLDCGIPLSRAPALAALTALARLDADDWPFRGILNLLSNNYFRPTWPEWNSGAAAAPTENAVRALQIPKGRRPLLDALSRWANTPTEEKLTDLRRQRQAAARVADALLRRLAKAFEKLPSTGTAAEWALAIEVLAKDVGMLSLAQTACDLPIARQDSVALALLLERLRASTEFESQINGAAQQLDRPAILERIEQICKIEQLPREHDDAGRVRVLSAAAARALDIPYLFVAGLSEKAFPAAASDQRIYSADDYQQMNKAGSRFVERHERACEEMLLFYEVVTRAKRNLVLSYSALDEAAQPLSPSPYLIEVERLFAPGAIARDASTNLGPVPTDTEPSCARDFRVKAVAMALDGSPRLAERLAGRAAQRESTSALLRAMRATAARASGEGFGPFEGIFAGETSHDRLVARFGSEHCWSTSQLEEYGYCPYQFFLKRVLRLNEPEDLSLEVDHYLRGRRVHALLAEVHRQLNAGGEPCSPSECDTDKFQRLISETLSAVIQSSAGGAGTLESAFDAIDQRLIARWIAQYLDQYVKYEESFKQLDSPPLPKHFEVSFGPVKDDESDQPADPLSKPAAYELTVNGATIRLSGRVDRIDLGVIDGQVVFNVLDYKTNASDPFRAGDITSCKALQLPLYAMAVEDLLLKGTGAIPWHGGYWNVRNDGFNPKRSVAFHERSEAGIRRTQLWGELRDRIVRHVASLVSGIQRGQFPMHCEDHDCTGRCGYKTVCRVHAVRALEKTWQAPSADE
jgi:ATP-dependent helicase/DNAse subunit B